MNDLERQVIRLIGENDTSPDVFTDDADGLEPVRDSLNDAVEEMCMVLGHYRRKYLMVCHEDRALYRLAPVNDDVGWVIGAWDRENNRALWQTDILAVAAFDPGFLSCRGTPEWFYQVGNSHLGLYPRPGSKGRVLELEMIAIPKPYQHGQTPIRLREQWQQAAVFRAVSDFYATRGDANRATEWFNRYLETANLMALHPEQAERLYQFGGYQRHKWSGKISSPE